MGLPDDAGSDPPRHDPAARAVGVEQRAERYADLLERAGGDGGSASNGIHTIPERAEGELLKVWFRERRRSIESSLILGRVCRLLSRIQADGRWPAESKRQVRQLLLEIEAVEGVDRAGDT